MLDKLLEPRAIAVIGASGDVRRPGGQCLYALTHFGFDGQVYPVNPRHAEIDGRRCHPDLTALPGRCDLAVIAVPAPEVAAVIEQCGAAGISSAVILSAGFREIGARGMPPQAGLDAAIRRSRVRVVGPNCVGVMNQRRRVYAGFGAAFRSAEWTTGPVAMISQSGGFAYSIVAAAHEAGIGFDYLVSTGNEADLGALDFIEHFLERDETRLVAVYLEGIADGRRLRALGQRALAAGKPIAVWKVGNSAGGQRAAVSHTANLTEAYDHYRDAFREGGFIEIREIYDLVDAARMFRAGRRPRGRGVAVVTASGGAGVLMADRCEEAGLALPGLAPQTSAQLATLLPEFAVVANPVDVTAALAQSEPAFSSATELVIADPNVDVAIVRSYPGREVLQWAQRLAAFAGACPKPILVSISGTMRTAAPWVERLESAGVACFEAPSRAVAAAGMLCDFTQRCERSARESPGPMRRTGARALPLPAGVRLADECEAKACVEAYGIPVPRSVFVPADQADGLAAPSLAFPLVLKAVSPDLPHKTEAGAVRIGIRDPDELRAAVATMRARVSSHDPRARLRGFLIEEQVQGTELIVGAVVNESFGPLVIVGMGGVQAELLRDIARRYAPVSVAQARDMVMSLRLARLLQGYRGAPACDIDALCDAVARLSLLIADHEDTVAELEVNPLMVKPAGRGVCAVDAMLRLRGPRS